MWRSFFVIFVPTEESGATNKGNVFGIVFCVWIFFFVSYLASPTVSLVFPLCCQLIHLRVRENVGDLRDKLRICPFWDGHPAKGETLDTDKGEFSDWEIQHCPPKQERSGFIWIQKVSLSG